MSFAFLRDLSTRPDTIKSDFSDFGDLPGEVLAARAQTILAPLTSARLVQAAGDDLDAFLQGQLSTDVLKLRPGHATLAAYSSPKGRVLAVLLLLRDDDGRLLIEIDRSIVDSTLKRLKLFILRSRVQLTERDDLVGLGVAGADSASALAGAGLPIPDAVGAITATASLQVVRLHGDASRYALYGTTDALATVAPALARRARVVGSTAWQAAAIAAGVPRVLPQTQDHFVAQMLNLDRLGAISFEKGCYTGQEVIARLHYLGNLKRRLFRGVVDGAAPPPGTPVHVADDAGQSAGEIVEAIDDGGDHALVLAVLQLGHAGAALRVGDAGAPLTLTEPPPVV